jgi:S-formylglutathione hydrolase FrmB
MRKQPWLVLCAALAPWPVLACGDDTSSGDAGDAADDAGEAGPERIGGLRLEPAFVGMQPGESRTVRLRVDFPPSVPIDFAVAVAPSGLVTVPPTVELPADAWYVDFEVQGDAVGTATATFSYDVRTATLTADVVSPDRTCAGSGAGSLAPGDTVAGTGGLADASATMPPDPTLEALDVTIACADDIVPAGFTALGPAVTFGPPQRWMRELTLTIPLKLGLLSPTAKVSDVTVFYTDGSGAARAVPFASLWVTGAPAGGQASFATRRFGTFQAAYETAAGTRTRTRTWTYRGIVGVSMGGGGAGYVGLRQPERFDFVAPLGGPINWTQMMHYVETYYLGGFCNAGPDDAGDVGEYCAVPAPTQPFERTEDFEHWYYPDGRDGQGGTFDRSEYCQIFRDMSLAFGNPGMYNSASVYLPPGVPQSWWELPGSERCANPVTLADFYDDEYNPDGAYPVITFCDGAEIAGDHGVWDPAGTNDYPLDVGLAVDVDGDTIRDPGEPVIRDGHEPYDDVGVDGVASALEAGYDAVTNPDPAGDDFDYQFNPSGTEGNWRWDGPDGTSPGEPYVDAGLDGVLGTPQQPTGYDWGEGNGRYDESPNFANYLAHDGYDLLMHLPEAQLDRLEILADAGIHDLFPFVVGEDAMMGALTARGRQVRYYNDFSALYGVPYADEMLDPKKIDFRTLGRSTMIRYGNPDADEAQLARGDGGHVGTVTQVINRLAYATFAMSARWPGGDRQRVASDTAYTMITDMLVSPSTGRESPYSIILPPGYYTDAFAETRYPVVFFLHGYGQSPEDMVTSAIIFQNWMITSSLPEDLRMQKLIMVFPDGRCRYPDGTPDYQKECIRGTFYADSVRPDGPQMETILFELMDYVDATYRTKAPEDLTETY